MQDAVIMLARLKDYEERSIAVFAIFSAERKRGVDDPGGIRMSGLSPVARKQAGSGTP
jgi:hypothetical protein